MAKIKHTKNELKAQREALQRYERFLPMLQLKKQQLQAEIQSITARIHEVDGKADSVRSSMRAWVALFSEPVDLKQYVSLEDVRVSQGNIAGVDIPVYEGVTLTGDSPDLFETPPWVDDAVKSLSTLIELTAERETLEEQKRRIMEELRTTSQRVNLFEKVKIPESRENIRIIKIFLGDQQTAAVARGKLAKKRTEQQVQERATA